jgi:hypothetical protein
MSCSLAEAYRHFGERYCLFLQGPSVRGANNQQEAGVKGFTHYVLPFVFTSQKIIIITDLNIVSFIVW